MASTNKTQYLKLPQWELSDKPDMSDYNTAFRSIDSVLKPPVIFPLSYTGNFENHFSGGNSVCSKDATNQVVINFCCVYTDGAHTGQADVIATLPEGYHPDQAYAQSVGFQSNTGDWSNLLACPFWVRPNGEVVIHPTTSGGKYFCGSISFRCR